MRLRSPLPARLPGATGPGTDTCPTRRACPGPASRGCRRARRPTRRSRRGGPCRPARRGPGRASGRTPSRSPGAGPGGRRPCRAPGPGPGQSDRRLARSRRRAGGGDPAADEHQRRGGQGQDVGPDPGRAEPLGQLLGQREGPVPSQRLIGQAPGQLLVGGRQRSRAVEPPDHGRLRRSAATEAAPEPRRRRRSDRSAGPRHPPRRPGTKTTRAVARRWPAREAGDAPPRGRGRRSAGRGSPARPPGRAGDPSTLRPSTTSAASGPRGPRGRASITRWRARDDIDRLPACSEPCLSRPVSRPHRLLRRISVGSADATADIRSACIRHDLRPTTETARKNASCRSIHRPARPPAHGPRPARDGPPDARPRRRAEAARTRPDARQPQ